MLAYPFSKVVKRFSLGLFDIDLEQDDTEHVLNRVRLYRDRRDFVIQAGDTGKREDYPVEAAREG